MGTGTVCCTTYGMDRMFSRHARRYAKKFRRKGLDKVQLFIIGELRKIGVNGKSILEIGCGVGGLHLTLLQQGASSACGVEVSRGMIAEAKRLAADLGVSEKVEYQQGDLISLNGEIHPAEIVIMDKVLCCYADPGGLIERSAAKARALFVVSYPRDALLARLVFRSTERIGTLLRWSFHPFYHEPPELDDLIRRQGFALMVSQITPIWQVRIFAREGG